MHYVSIQTKGWSKESTKGCVNWPYSKRRNHPNQAKISRPYLCFLCPTFDVSEPVGVRVSEGRDEEVVDDLVLPPLVHAALALGLLGRSISIENIVA